MAAIGQVASSPCLTSVVAGSPLKRSHETMRASITVDVFDGGGITVTVIAFVTVAPAGAGDCFCQRVRPIGPGTRPPMPPEENPSGPAFRAPPLYGTVIPTSCAAVSLLPIDEYPLGPLCSIFHLSGISFEGVQSVVFPRHVVRLPPQVSRGRRKALARYKSKVDVGLLTLHTPFVIGQNVFCDGIDIRISGEDANFSGSKHFLVSRNTRCNIK